jgi:hypothetical protein
MRPLLLPGPALATFILRPLIWAALHPPRNFSSDCRPRHAERSDGLAIFRVETIGEAPTAEERLLC